MLTTRKSFKAKNVVGTGAVQGEGRAQTRSAIPMKPILQRSRLRYSGKVVFPVTHS